MFPPSDLSVAALYVPVVVLSAISLRLFYCVFLHPLAKFPGPWYAVSSSLPLAIISVLKIEPQWLQGLVRKYGSESYSRSEPGVRWA
jgi:hypothetical protein